MKVFRYLLPAFMVCTIASSISAEIDERELQAVEDFIEQKRAVTVQDKGGDLFISGDVRVEYQSKTTKRDGEKYRGTTSEKNSSNQHRSEMEWDVEANLYFDYRTECTWAHMTLEFDNDMGLLKEATPYVHLADNYNEDNSSNVQYQGTGTCDSLCIERAYFGMNVYDNGCFRADTEIGRWKFYDLFESRVQFGSNFDGIVSRYSYSWDCVADFYLTSGNFLVDSNYYHMGMAIEIGALNIYDWGIDAKYSYVDWSKKGSSGHDNSDNIKNNKAFQYCNSQFLLAWNVDPEWLGNRMRVYGAYLINHDAKKVFNHDDKAENAWYIGASYGKLEKACDYYIDINYQEVQRQAVPHWDVIGIGRDDWKRDQGQAGYKGWLVELAYNITDNINAVVEYEYSKDTDSDFPLSSDEDDTLGTHKYQKFEIELKYLF